MVLTVLHMVSMNKPPSAPCICCPTARTRREQLVFLVAIGAMLGVMIAANEASKENHTVAPKGKANQPAMLMDVNNKPVTVAGRNAQTNHAGRSSIGCEK